MFQNVSDIVTGKQVKLPGGDVRVIIIGKLFTTVTLIILIKLNSVTVNTI